MNAQAFAEHGAAQARFSIQCAYTEFLQKVEQRATAEKAQTFAMSVTHGNSVKFRGMNREQVYKVLTGNYWPQ